MKRQCCICKNEFRYDKVKLRGPHKVKMCNYYIELEQTTLTDVQSTQLTLSNLRTIASR